VIVFAPGNSGGLKRVSQAGGVPTPVTLLDGFGGNSDRFPEFLPDKGRFVYLRGDQTERSGIYAGSLDGRAPVRLLADLSYAAYVPPKAPDRTGYLLFRRENTLMAQPFDPDGLRLTGELFPVAESVGRGAVLGTDTFSVSTNGVLAYGSLSMSGLRELVWRDRSGKRLNLVTKPAQIARMALSPDGESAALTLGVVGSVNIWLRDLNRNQETRFTFPPGWSMDPVWSPDGTHIAFRSSPRDRTYGLYEKPVTGPGKQELLMAASPVNGFPLDWSPDGKWIVYTAAEKGNADLMLLPLEGDRKPVPYLSTQYNETQGQFSPNGRWMAYSSDDSGQMEVYVQSIPADGVRKPISTAGGDQPRWRRDGTELYYSAGGKLMAVPVKINTRFEAGVPQPLFDGVPGGTPANRIWSYQPSADGRKFLLMSPAGGVAPASPVSVVLNWQAGSGK
jgi:WD40 repeat protein